MRQPAGKATAWRKPAAPIPPTNNCLRQQATCAGGGTIRIRRSMTPATDSGWISARSGDAMDGAIEADHLRRIRFCHGRSLHQPAQRLLRSAIERERDAFLVASGMPPMARPGRRGATILWPISALQAIYEYWTTMAKRTAVVLGRPMILTPFCCAWNWDARPFPTFPLDASVWGDAANWPAGNWIGGKGPLCRKSGAGRAAGSGLLCDFPHVFGQGWSVRIQATLCDPRRRPRCRGARRARGLLSRRCGTLN